MGIILFIVIFIAIIVIIVSNLKMTPEERVERVDDFLRREVFVLLREWYEMIMELTEKYKDSKEPQNIVFYCEHHYGYSLDKKLGIRLNTAFIIVEVIRGEREGFRWLPVEFRREYTFTSFYEFREWAKKVYKEQTEYWKNYIGSKEYKTKLINIKDYSVDGWIFEDNNISMPSDKKKMSVHRCYCEVCGKWTFFQTTDMKKGVCSCGKVYKQKNMRVLSR